MDRSNINQNIIEVKGDTITTSQWKPLHGKSLQCDLDFHILHIILSLTPPKPPCPQVFLFHLCL
jgi:hypothetical protein